LTAQIYALRCVPTGELWVGRATDLEAIERRLRFAIRMTSTPHRSLLAAAKAHGEPDFSFETLERIEEKDASPELIQARLKSRGEHWRGTLGAEAI
jgi:hypothetical protein